MPGQAFPFSNEKSLLLAFIAQQRDGVRNAAFGLTDEQARLTPTAGDLSIGGLVKHVTAMERQWIAMALQTPPEDSQDEQETDYLDGFRLLDHETLADAIAALDAAGVTYAGSAAIRALVEVRNLVVGHGGHFELVLPSPPLQRVLEVLGLESHFAA